MIPLEHLATMKHSPISNYGGIPGVTSWLIGTPSGRGLVRLMECSRTHQEPVIPHSHRFDFVCLVLSGSVRNLIWEPYATSDQFVQSTITYGGEPGQYTKKRGAAGGWRAFERRYQKDETYSMKADEVHSIFFSRGTSVLFFEGPQVSDTSVILEPFVDGDLVPTFKVEPWAFKRVPA